MVLWVCYSIFKRAISGISALGLITRGGGDRKRRARSTEQCGFGFNAPGERVFTPAIRV
jgi:hypothetical protein